MHSQHNIYEPEALDDPPKSPFAQHITQGSLQKKLSFKVCILSQPALLPERWESQKRRKNNVYF